MNQRVLHVLDHSIARRCAYPRHSMRLTEPVTPLKPLEAMAQGPLQVASDAGGHKGLIRHGEAGSLFTAGDAHARPQAIEHPADGQADWPQLRAQGRPFVEAQRNWRAIVAHHPAAYRQASLQTADV